VHYRQEIEGLRAIAVTSVIINHFSPSVLPGGFLGVDVFFVISGFVITLSLDKSREQNLWDFIGRFYERRVKRLLPALATMIVVVSILVSLFDPDPRRTLLTGLSALFGLSNMAMVWTSTDYFAPATEFNAFLHTWSLGVEEQYYVVYPLLFWYLLRSNDAGTSARGLRGLGVLALLSLALFIWLSGREEMLAFYFMPARFWELAVGCLLYLATS
jgi:peptidoglycan/LPS O-acetylase OafA/YrhL